VLVQNLNRLLHERAAEKAETCTATARFSPNSCAPAWECWGGHGGPPLQNFPRYAGSNRVFV